MRRNADQLDLQTYFCGPGVLAKAIKEACQEANCSAVDFAFAKVRSPRTPICCLLLTHMFLGTLLNADDAKSQCCCCPRPPFTLLLLYHIHLRLLRGCRVFPAVLCVNLFYSFMLREKSCITIVGIYQLGAKQRVNKCVCKRPTLPFRRSVSFDRALCLYPSRRGRERHSCVCYIA